MSEETADAKGLFNNEVRIKGTVISFEKMVSKAGKDWAKLTLEHIRKFKDEETPERYEISVFGKVMEGQGGQIRQHDEVEVVCRVQADEWKERWYVKLLLKDVKFLQIGNRNKPADNAGIELPSGTREVSAPAIPDDEHLPF